MNTFYMGRWILLCISYSLPKNKSGIGWTYILYSDHLTNTWPISMFLSTHAWLQFSIKINPILFVAFCLRFYEGTKNMELTMELDVYAADFI